MFGHALVIGNFNGDLYGDLAFGVPYEDTGPMPDVGIVHVLLGNASGLSSIGAKSFNQDSAEVPGANEANDQFGFSLAAGDFDGNGYSELAIGVPYEDIGTIPNAGAVTILPGSSTGPTASGSKSWYQDTQFIQGVCSSGDLFGYSLAASDTETFADLAIGVPGETNTSGAINVLWGGPYGGLMHNGNKIWAQSSVLETVELGDRFGWQVSMADFNGDGNADVAVSVPGEDLGGIIDAGAVHVLYSLYADASSQFWSQNSLGILDSCEANDGLGRALSR